MKWEKREVFCNVIMKLLYIITGTGGRSVKPLRSVLNLVKYDTDLNINLMAEN